MHVEKPTMAKLPARQIVMYMADWQQYNWEAMQTAFTQEWTMFCEYLVSLNYFSFLSRNESAWTE